MTLTLFDEPTITCCPDVCRLFAEFLPCNHTDKVKALWSVWNCKLEDNAFIFCLVNRLDSLEVDWLKYSLMLTMNNPSLCPHSRTSFPLITLWIQPLVTYCNSCNRYEVPQKGFYPMDPNPSHWRQCKKNNRTSHPDVQRTRQHSLP